MDQVKEIPVIVTYHAKKRMIQRMGINKKSVQRMANRAFRNGYSQAETKGGLNRYIDQLLWTNPNANNIRIYGDKVFIFLDDLLITVLQIPVSLTKNMKKMVDRDERTAC